ncbi:MAG: FG-GAP repeat protein [Planctomycetes bacterium]|nr:FG-GAP repeat protein [Planctomycetota bacterium]
MTPLQAYSVASAGDMDGDGFADVALGAPFGERDQEDEGRVLVYRGSPKALGPSPAFVLEGNQAAAQLGASVAAAGDVNMDGFADLIAGAPRHHLRVKEAGRACVSFGWGPKVIDVLKTRLFEPQEEEAHTLPGMEPADVRAAIERGLDEEPDTTGKFLVSLRAFFEEGMRGPRRSDAMDELATLRPGIPDDLWERYFGDYRLFTRGDSNADRKIDISDGIHTLRALFSGASLTCRDAADSNDDGRVDISDAVYLFSYLFIGGDRPPPDPFDEPGLDPTDDGLECKSY